MIEKIGFAVVTIGGILAYVFNLGKNNERNKTNKAVLNKVKATSKRRQARANDTLDDDLDWVLKHKDD